MNREQSKPVEVGDESLVDSDYSEYTAEEIILRSDIDPLTKRRAEAFLGAIASAEHGQLELVIREYRRPEGEARQYAFIVQLSADMPAA